MKQKKVRRSQAEWTSLVAQQAQSGQTITDFCHSHGLTQNTFIYWRQKLKNKTTTNTPNKFITLIPGERAGSASRLLLLRGRGGVEVEAPCDLSPDVLQALITALSC